MSDTTVWACGVLEGGGAKGAAYAPALEEFAEHGIKFCSVAGSSAGALTATLIAAGCSPEEIRRLTLEALKELAPPRFKHVTTLYWAMRGLRRDPPRLRPIDKVERLVETKLRSKLGWPDERRGPVTFADLQERDDPIELFVVAVDAVGKREYVFHHAIDSAQGVASAAVSSAAIPLYFPPGQPTPDPALPEPERRPYPAILFDGGTWSNFPTWIYKDPSFRAYHGAVPAVSTAQTGSRDAPVIVGLLLDEESEARASGGSGSASLAKAPGFFGQSMARFGRFFLFIILAFTSPIYLFCLAFFVLIALATGGCLVSGGHFCDVQASAIFPVLDIGSGSFTVYHIIFLVAGLGFVYQEVRFFRQKRSGVFITKYYPYAELVGSFVGVGLVALAAKLANADIHAPPQRADQPFLQKVSTAWPDSNAFGAIALSIVGLVTIISLAAVALLAPAMQGMGRKVMFVLTSAGSARYWVGRHPDDHVVRIPVKGLDTLSFAEAREFVEKYSEGVRNEVSDQLDELLSVVQSRSHGD